MEEGIRFSLLYLDRSKSLRDSKRFRNRLAAFYWESLYSRHQDRIVTAIHRDIGAEVPMTYQSYSVRSFFKTSELRDLLDSITVIYKALAKAGYVQRADQWKNFVSNALSEENLGYQLDNKCGVHYSVDEEFERNRFSTLKALQHPQYSSVRDAYDKAYQYLDAQPIDTVHI